MPVLFIGHGSPMNAIEKNTFTKEWVKIANSIPRPKAILCISAHWHKNSPTEITASEKLHTIHDFHGFPKQLFEVNYSPLGNETLCQQISQKVSATEIKLNHEYGIDHGAWSILMHMFPKADISVLQLSIDKDKNPQWHYELGKELKFLRNEDVLIIGSGNIVHNLSLLDWQYTKSGYEWANSASEKLKKLIFKNDIHKLTDYTKLGAEVNLAIPSPEHFLPLLYVLGMKEHEDNIIMFNDELVMGSLSMTSLRIG